MKKTLIALAMLGIPLALSGCQTTEEAAAQRVAVAAVDDSECRSYGADKGTAIYVQCRMLKGQQHSQETAAAEAARSRQINCGMARMASAFGTAEQQYSNTMALASSGC